MNHECDGECDATRHIHAAFMDMVHAATVKHIGLLTPISLTCEFSRAARPPVTGPRRLRGAQGVPLGHFNGSGSPDQTSTEFGRSEAPKRALSRVKHGSEGASRRHGFRAAVAILSWRELELRALSPHLS